MKTKVIVEFVFETKGDTKDIVQSIDSQINTDLNAYWQNDDDTAQMELIQITKIQDISKAEYKKMKGD